MSIRDLPARAEVAAPWRRRAAAVCFAAAAASSAVAQPAPSRIVVTGTREPVPLASVAADLVVIDEAALRDRGAASLEDLLRLHAGLQISRSGGPGQNAGVFIRGAAVGSTVVLIDGVRVGSATLGQALLESIDPAMVERVEVLRGPGSSLYGADAMGGVVQIFTRRGRGAPWASAHAAAGGLGSAEIDAAAGGRVGDIDLAATLSRQHSDGVSAVRAGDLFGLHNPDRDGYTRRAAQASLGYAPAPGHRIGLQAHETRLNAQYDGAEYNPPTFAPDPSPDFRNHLRTRVVALDYRGELMPRSTTRLQLARHDDTLVSGGTSGTRFRTERQQFGAQQSWTPSPGQLLLAAYERTRERASAPLYAGRPSRDNDALVLATTVALGDAPDRHVLQADLRHDRSSLWGGVTTGRLGFSHAFAPGWRARALAGTTFRAPSFNELAFPGYGVATLQPEHGRSIEAGVEWQRDVHQASVTVYRNRVRDLVAYEADRSFCPSDPAYDFGCARNVARARMQGATLSGATRLGAWSLRAQLDFVDAKDLGSGQRLARRAAHQESVDASVDLGDWTLGASLLSLGARPDAGKQLAAERTIDLRAHWRLAERWRVEARLLNATDRRLEPSRDYAAPGRQAWLGLRFDTRGL